jgi:hypothetical protein
MSSRANFTSPKVPEGLKRPGVAMELVTADAEIAGLANSDVNRKTFKALQRWDELLFIPVYVLSFGSAGMFASKALTRGRWLGIVIIALVVAAAGFDYVEDERILSALKSLNGAAGISWAAYRKWGLLFAMLVCFMPFFLRRWNSGTLRVLGVPFALYTAFSGIVGVVSCVYERRPQIEDVAAALAAPVIFVMLVGLFHRSGMDGLNRLSNWPVLKQLVAWPELKQKRKA